MPSAISMKSSVLGWSRACCAASRYSPARVREAATSSSCLAATNAASFACGLELPGELLVDFGARGRHERRGDRRLLAAGEDSVEGVVVLLADRVELVVVAPGA